MTEIALYDKIKACWIGKNIGGTLGGPTEGKAERLNLTDLPDLSGCGALPNDDLDLQLLNLHVLEQRGFRIDAADIAAEWEEHVFFPYDEYGYALTNMREGMVPPLSSYCGNPFTDCMGSPIRSELWACIAPGRPEVAAYYACQDAMVDHAGGEGVAGEVFFAALESLAFVERDILTLIDKAATFVPKDSVMMTAVYDTIAWYKSGVTYDEIRDRILEKYGAKNFTDAPQNIAFVIVGLMYGTDFKDAMLKTVNLGYDTDCTAATLGSIYGILYGTAGIPAQWANAVGEEIKISFQVRGFDYPRTITELTERTVRAGKALENERKFDYDRMVPAPLDAQVYRLPFCNRPDDCLAVTVVPEDGPLCEKGKQKRVAVRFDNRTADTWNFSAAVDGNGTAQSTPDITLKPDEFYTWTCVLDTASVERDILQYRLTVSRYYDRILWKDYTVSVVLPVVSVWVLDGKNVHGNKGCVCVRGAGHHRLETRMTVPEERDIKLMFAGSQPMRIYLDGHEAVVSQETTPYIPAYHRGPRHLRYTAHMTAGEHVVAFDIDSAVDACEVAVMPTTVDYQTEYSSEYMTDCFFGC